MGIAEVITVFAIVATNLITVITLYIHQDNKTTTLLTAIHDEVKGIQSEMKDFHGRLCSIEERKNK